ncbi:alpha-mannosidase [Trichothermofontia sp.]
MSPVPADAIVPPLIPQTIAQLAQCSRCTCQTHWHYQVTPPGSMAPLAAPGIPDGWESWPIASLNDKGHLAWPKGQQECWFVQKILIPNHLNRYPIAGLTLRLALHWWAAVAEVWVDGELRQVGDLFDCKTRVLLSEAIAPGMTFLVAIRLVSPGHDPGALVASAFVVENLDPDTPEPGFVADELAVITQYLETFIPALLPTFTTYLTPIAEKLSVLANQAVAEQAVADRADFDLTLARLRQQLQTWAIQPEQTLSTWLKQRQISLLGHAHLDLAWLWPIAETWEAAERTFTSVLNLQADFPELIFGHSSPALYAWLETHRPELFSQIQSQVKTGRWEIVAGLWVEPDFNLIQGESLVRQVLYGQRYIQEKLGVFNRIAWLSDSFGFCWQLPQILQQAGIDYFVTQKLRWNDTTQPSNDLFWWQAPDGSQVLSLMSAPIGEDISPVKMATYACEWEQKTGELTALWLPGVGDHGGGPTRDMLEVARRWQRSPFFPELCFQTVLEFLDQFKIQNSKLNVHNSELYLEFHRGCYTTHADQKAWNRCCENLLYEAELFASLTQMMAAQAGEDITNPMATTQAQLTTAWQQVLFNQFHDILPGTAIPEVYVEANRGWQAAEQTAQTILDQALAAISDRITIPEPPVTGAIPLVVFNSLNWARSQVVTVTVPDANSQWQIYDLAGQPLLTQPMTAETSTDPSQIAFLTPEIPGVGYHLFWLAQQPASPKSKNLKSKNLKSKIPPVQRTGAYTLENAYLRVTVDPATGNLSSVWDKQAQREVLQSPGNQLQFFADTGQYWDAWNIDPNYAQHPLPAPELKVLQWLDMGPIIARLRIIRQFGQSTFWQDYILEAESPLLKIKTTVNWQERHTLVKAAFPVNIEADVATYEIACGAIERPLRSTQPADRAKWEVPALRWADLTNTLKAQNSQDNPPIYGVSLLNDCKYGYDAQPDRLRLTLLRGATWPDPEADCGQHQFTYALYPHLGNWQTAHTVRQGYALNVPLRARLLIPTTEQRASATLSPIGTLLSIPAENLVLMALKPAEDQAQHWVLRCYECHGQAAEFRLVSDLALTVETPVDLLERSSIGVPSGSSPLVIPPWKIMSFQVGPCLLDEPRV